MGIEWKAADKFPLAYLRIGNENGQSDHLLSMESDFYPERANFWWKLAQEAHYPLSTHNDIEIDDVTRRDEFK